MPEDCEPNYGDMRFFPVKNTYLVKGIGAGEPYVVNSELIVDEMLRKFVQIPQLADCKAQVESIKGWLGGFGLPVKSSILSANHLFSAAYSTDWLKRLLELACSEPDRKGSNKDKLNKFLVIDNGESGLIDIRTQIGVSFSPNAPKDFFIFNFRARDEMANSKAGTHVMRRVWNVYPKEKLNLDNIFDLKFVAKHYVSTALGFILSGIRPSIVWTKQNDGRVNAYDILTVTNPWQAMNYELHKRLLTGGDTYKPCKTCREYFCSKTIRGAYCSNKCRQKKYRQTR